MNTTVTNILAIFFKFGLKILSITAKSGKFWMAGASAASYAYMYSWKFAMLIMFQLFVHEYGHVWAMKRCGLKVKGVYFIPFLGAAAVSDEDLAKSGRADELYIAIMGPIWGFFPALLMAILCLATGSQFFMAAASWMCLVNLFNLIPLNPLDGGRIVKSLAFSLHDWLGLLCMFAGMSLLFVGCVLAGIGVFAVLGFVSLIELLSEFRKLRKAPEEIAMLENKRSNIKESRARMDMQKLRVLVDVPAPQVKEYFRVIATEEEYLAQEDAKCEARIKELGTPRAKIAGREWAFYAMAYIMIVIVFLLMMIHTDLGGAMEILSA